MFPREVYDFGTPSVSRPLLQKSQSATFSREISDFGTQNSCSAASGEGGTPKTKLKGSSPKIVQLTSPS